MHMQKPQFRCAGRASWVRTTDLMCSPSSPAAAAWFGGKNPLFWWFSVASLELRVRAGRAPTQRGVAAERDPQREAGKQKMEF